MTPAALQYTINAGRPQPSFPYDLLLQVSAVRSGPDGTSSAQGMFFIPILGAISKEVPNFYPVASNPNMIFLVLRDPPGGGSSTTIHAGTTIDFAMSVDGMSTYDDSTNTLVHSEIGASFSVDLEVAPLGLGSAFSSISVDDSLQINNGHHFTTSSHRLSHTAYEYSFYFEYDFSTSTDPNIAGHPSDVIVGGGVDLIVSEAIEVVYGKKDPQLTCLISSNTYMWQPGKATTFVLPVVTIERLKSKLQGVVSDMQFNLKNNIGSTNASDIIRVQKLVDNWASVLSAYRSHNDDVVQFFSAENTQFLNMLKVFTNFKNGGIKEDEFLGAFANTMGEVSHRSNLVNYFHKSFDELSSTCSGIFNNDYVSSTCSDFASSKSDWKDLYHFINGACDMPDSPDNSNPLSNSAMMQSLCKQEAVGTNNGIPGGLTASGESYSLMGFLNQSTKYITFGSNAPVTLSWTSTVTDSISFSAGDDSSVSTDDAQGFHADNAMGVKFFFDVDSGEANGLTLSIGKQSDNSHSYERTVTINLDDSDDGDYFAVKITEDPVFATPVFTTMGGQSKCPGETGTSRRESGVRIVNIIPRCGPQRNQPCDATTLNYAEVATFGVVIENLSPTGDTVDYTIGFKNSYEDYYPTSFQGVHSTSAGHCGTPNQRSGLMAQFVDTDLTRIPYNKLVEVSVAVFNGGGFGSGSLTLCNDFVDVEIFLSCTCEIPTPSGFVYQYGVVQDPVSKLISVSYDPIDRIYPANYTATLSVSWPAAPSRRSLLNTSIDHEDLGRTLISMNGSIDGLNSVMEAKLDTRNSELNMQLVAFNSSVENKINILDSKVVALEATISGIHDTVGSKLNQLVNDMDKKMEKLDTTMGEKIDDLTASFSALEQKLLESIQSPTTSPLDNFSSLLWMSLFVCGLCINFFLWWATKKSESGDRSAV